jgi:hypothetical protein
VSNKPKIIFIIAFWGIFSFGLTIFWFIGHQTMAKVQKYAYTNANTPSSETYRSDLSIML